MSKNTDKPMQPTTRRRVLQALACIATGTGLSTFTGGSATAASPPREAQALDMGSINESGIYQTDTPSGSISQLWRQNFPDQNISRLFVRDGQSNRVYCAGRDHLLGGNTIYALEKNSGDELWSKEVNSPPILALEPGERLYYTTTSTSQITALAPADGSTSWNASPQGVTSGPTVLTYIPPDQTLYLTALDIVVALDNETGNKQWEVAFDPGAVNLAFPSFYDRPGASLLHVTGSQIEDSGNLSGFITAIDREAETELWTDNSRNSQAYGIPIYIPGENNVYLSYVDGLVAYDAENGTEQWTESRADNLVWQTLAQDQSALYVSAVPAPDSQDGTNGGALTKFEPDGTQAWEYDIGALLVGAIFGDNSVYVSAQDGRVISIDDSSGGNAGTEEWSLSLSGGGDITDGGLRLADNILYTGSDAGRVYAISTADGSELDTFDLSEPRTHRIVTIEDHIWVAGRQPFSATSGESAVYKLSGSDSGGVGTLSVALSPSSITAGEQTDVTVTVTDASDSAVSGATIEITDLGLSETTDASGKATLSLTNPDAGNLVVSVSADGFADVTATLTVNPDGSGANPFPDGIGGGDDPPTDPDGDGLYEDVNGDGTADFGDAIALAFADTDSLTQAQQAALDFDGDGNVDFDDAIELAFI